MQEFLNNFVDHKFRFIDETGASRGVVKSTTFREDLNMQGYGAFFTVNGFPGTANTRENLSVLNGFFADIDGTKELPKKFPLDPTYIIETKNGHHIYWLLDEPIYKNEVESEEQWNQLLIRYDHLLYAVIDAVGGDKNAKDATRVLRVPDTYYWKKTGDAWKNGEPEADSSFKIKIKKYNPAKRYSFNDIAEGFPMVVEEQEIKTGSPVEKRAISKFFEKVNQIYPLAERPSTEKLISGAPGTLPEGIESRNRALLIAATLYREMGYTEKEAVNHFLTVGWHGIELERGGTYEIKRTIHSAYHTQYSFARTEQAISHNITIDELEKYTKTITAVTKDMKDEQKLFFSQYEKELKKRYPYYMCDANKHIFGYVNGIYKRIKDADVLHMIMRELDYDGLLTFKTRNYAMDKLENWKAIMPLINKDARKVDDILNCKNGLVNLKTGVLSPHTPEYISFLQIPVAYDPKAQCPNFEKFIAQVTAGPEEEKKAKILKMFTGSLMTRNTKDYSKALFIVGAGANGKSTFAETVQMLIGRENTSALSLDQLTGQFDLIGIMDKRLNICEEISGNYVDTSFFKKFVSGERINVDVKYKDSLEFNVETKFMFAVNSLPRMSEYGPAVQRRMLVVMFRNSFLKAPVKQLRGENSIFVPELPGILNWAIEGYRMLIDNSSNYSMTDEHDEMMEEYKLENSPVLAFIDECFGEKEGNFLEVNDMYNHYAQYCKLYGYKHKSKISFSKELRNAAENNENKIAFTFLNRKNGKTTSRVEGLVPIDDIGTAPFNPYREKVDMSVLQAPADNM